jgi:outer membrane receptor for ferrienterochelin and colicin
VEGEYYHNELTANRYKDVTLLDTSLLFPLSKKVELKGSLSNVLNKRTYHYTTYSQLSSFQSERRLRGRELLFTITLKK